MAGKKRARAQRNRRGAKPPPATMDRDAWALAALNAMARQGTLEVSVEALARELGVTKGSFYWHFESRDALQVAALETWERVGTTRIIDALAALPDPRLRLERLLAVIFERTDYLAVEGAFYAASAHPRLGPIVHRVNDRRFRYLREQYEALGFCAAEAETWAMFAYSTFLGAVMLAQTTTSMLEHALEQHYAAHVTRLLVPPSPCGRPPAP